MKQIYDVLKLAWELGIKVTEIELTKEQVKDILVDDDKTLTRLNTDFGEVKIKYEKP